MLLRLTASKVKSTTLMNRDLQFCTIRVCLLYVY